MPLRNNARIMYKAYLPTTKRERKREREREKFEFLVRVIYIGNYLFVKWTDCHLLEIFFEIKFTFKFNI